MLLFLRPTNGVYLPPKVIRMEGKSTVEDIGVVQRDMPNFFVEAVTIADGRVYTESKEIVVPPEKRILNVEVIPSKLPSPSGRGAGGEGGETASSPRPLAGEGSGVRADSKTKSAQTPDSPHPNPLPKGEGTEKSPLPKGEGTEKSPLPEGEGTMAFRPDEKARVRSS